jgi:cell division protein DivIC
VNINYKIIQKIPPFFRNKYFLTLSVFLLWILLFDANNLIERVGQLSKLHKLRIEKEYYSRRIEEDKKKLNELKTDNHNLEKFAREQYLMKRKDEDLYIVLTRSEERRIKKKGS